MNEPVGDHDQQRDTVVDATFDVDRSPAEVWTLLEQLRVEHLPADTGDDQWWLPGFRTRCVELSSDPERGLVVRKDEEPCRGTTIAVTIEHEATGSRIRVVQSGFDPAFVDMAGEHFWAHADAILTEFETFLRTGALPADT